MKNYIPQNKSDDKALENLKSMDFELIKPDVPELLVWLQDFNWGFAQGITAYLAPHVNEIKKELIDILNTNDDDWKHNIIVSLMAESPKKLDHELIAILKRITEQPTKSEINEEVDVVAKQVLNNQ